MLGRNAIPGALAETDVHVPNADVRPRLTVLESVAEFAFPSQLGARDHIDIRAAVLDHLAIVGCAEATDDGLDPDVPDVRTLLDR